jgi:hypothetical protein
MKKLFLSLLLLLSFCMQPLRAQNEKWRHLGDTLLSSWNTTTLLTAIQNGTPYLAVQAYDLQGSVFWTVQRWDGSEWQSMDTTGLGAWNYTAWGFAANGAPKLAFYNNDSKTFGIKQLVNGTWINTTESPQITGLPTYVTMTFDQEQLFVAYSDQDQNGRVSVWAFNGTQWTPLNATGISEGNVYPLVLKSDNGTPWIAYQEIQQGYAGIVKRYNGSQWEQVGNPAFDGNVHGSMGFTVVNNTPYLVHADSSTQNHARVLTFNGTDWTPVGSPMIVPTSYYLNITVDEQSGTPYILLDDSGPNFWGLSVMRYNGSDWEFVGERGFIHNYWSVNLLLHEGTPYIGYLNGPFGQPASVQVFSQTTRTPDIQGLLGFVQLFPNPVIGQTVKLYTQARENFSCQARLMDQQGRVVAAFQLMLPAGESTHNLSIPDLPQGMYHFQVLAENGMVHHHQRFVVLK